MENFPRITVVAGTYLFKIDMDRLFKEKQELVYNSNSNNDNNFNGNNFNGNGNSNNNNNNKPTTKQTTKIGLQLLT